MCSPHPSLLEGEFDIECFLCKRQMAIHLSLEGLVIGLDSASRCKVIRDSIGDVLWKHNQFASCILPLDKLCENIDTLVLHGDHIFIFDEVFVAV